MVLGICTINSLLFALELVKSEMGNVLFHYTMGASLFGDRKYKLFDREIEKTSITAKEKESENMRSLVKKTSFGSS